MNWFQRFITNPNVHALGSSILNAAQPVAVAMGHPEVAVVIAAMGTVAGVQAAGTPEKPVADAIPGHISGGPVVQLPPSANGGSYHADDWIKLAATLATQFGGIAPPVAK